jgi:hypothetical protein
MDNEQERWFPISGDKELKAMPWRLIEPHRESAKRFTGSTLERLAERGGLSVVEILSIVTGDDHWNWKRKMR